MDWFDYLELAQELAKKDSEACQRSAVSRAYYAIYCTVRDKLDTVGEFNPPNEGSDHKYLWNRMAQDPYNLTWVRDHGQDLRDKRVEADYGPYIDNLHLFVEDTMILAEELATFLNHWSA